MCFSKPLVAQSMDEHGLPTNFGGEGMAMSAEYSTEDGEEEEEFKVTVHCWYQQCWEIRDILFGSGSADLYL
jgi:hypothetical protein